MGNTFKTLLIWVSLAVILMMSFNALEGDKKSDDTQIEYSAFIQQVRSNQVESVVLESERVMEGYIIKGVRKDENKSKFYTHSPADQN